MKTPEQKKLAVLVAKDVLKMLKPRAKLKYIPKHGTYISINSNDTDAVYKKYKLRTSEKIAKDVLKQGLVKHCQACAIGGFFIAHVMRKDGLTVKDFISNKTLFTYASTGFTTHEKSLENGRLGECFNTSELKAIENTFEFSFSDVDAAIAMKFICDRIVENDGEYKGFSAKEVKKIVKENVTTNDPFEVWQ